MKKRYKIPLYILLFIVILIIAAGIYVFQRKGALSDFGGATTVESPSVESIMPNVNPMGTQTNPFEQYQNPFEE